MKSVSTQALAKLLDVAATEEMVWPDEDLAQQFKACMTMSWSDLVRLTDGLAADVPAGTVREGLSREHLSLATALAIRQFARELEADTDLNVPRAVCTVIYYLPIAACLACGRACDSALSLDDLRRGLTWCRDKHWLPGWASDIFMQAIPALDDQIYDPPV